MNNPERAQAAVPADREEFDKWWESTIHGRVWNIDGVTERQRRAAKDSSWAAWQASRLSQAQPLAEQVQRVQLPPLDTTEEERSHAGATLRKPYGANLQKQLEIAHRHLANKWGDLLCRERQLLATLAKAEALPVRSYADGVRDAARAVDGLYPLSTMRYDYEAAKQAILALLHQQGDCRP